MMPTLKKYCGNMGIILDLPPLTSHQHFFWRRATRMSPDQCDPQHSFHCCCDLNVWWCHYYCPSHHSRRQHLMLKSRRSPHHCDPQLLLWFLNSPVTADGNFLCCFTIGGIGTSSQWLINKWGWWCYCWSMWIRERRGGFWWSTHSLLLYHEALHALQEVQQYLESKPNYQGCHDGTASYCNPG